ncbi:MAG: DM13 domain-containing protein [Leptolyngbya sp. SIO4C1]|nr:DM13 domain-containing protein [Leptolyngbya sp. SIO4C1]
MGMLTGSNDYNTTGSVSAAIFGGGSSSIHFNNFHTNAEASDLQVYLTINGNLEKRKLDLGAVPENDGSFEMDLPDGTDVSLFNTIVIYSPQAEASIGSGTIP